MTTAYDIERTADHLPAAYDWAPAADSLGIGYHDFFCGAGGSSIGLTEAGFTLLLGANHWQVAIDTHSANFTRAEHLCADLQGYDLRRLPRGARLLWASPICTEASPAGGRQRRTRTGAQGELELFGPPPKDGWERTRVTFWEIVRAAELWAYDAIIVENVPEVAVGKKAWPLFNVWVLAMETLGYVVQFVSVSSAHVGGETNPYAPQWRDRLYIVLSRKDVPLPDVEPRPLAWCPTCAVDVHAVQAWKRPGRRIGKYGALRGQYVYVCPRTECRHVAVEPYVAPAASIIDWSDIGIRIGDRKRPLAAKTLARVQAGIDLFWGQPITLEAAGNTHERWVGARTHPAFAAPLTTLTTDRTKGVATPPAFVDVARTHNRPRGVDEPLAPLTTGRNHGLVRPPFIAELRGGHSDVRSTEVPLATVTAGGNHHMLTCPPEVAAFLVTNNGGYAQPHQLVKPIDAPMSTVTARDTTALVIPFRKGARPHRPNEPISTVATREQHGLAHLGGVDPEDCYFRMLNPREHLAAQRFPATYVVTGDLGDQTMQAGNAVSANVAHWLGAAVAAVLSGAAS